MENLNQVQYQLSHVLLKIKHSLKLNKNVLQFNELEQEVKNAIYKVKKENYENYFTYVYKNEENIKKVYQHCIENLQFIKHSIVYDFTIILFYY